MKNVVIKSVKLEGFRSYIQPVTFPFGVTGLYLIKGDNGEGKTTIIEALAWCLYKINLKGTVNNKVSTWKWKRGKDYKGTRVICMFNVNKYRYMVARHLGYKGKTKGLTGEDTLMIFRKHMTDEQPFSQAHFVTDELHKGDQQAYLNRVLGINSDIFINSILFGQRMQRLMSSKDADKRDLFENLFSVDFIDGLKETANARLSESNAVLITQQTNLNIVTNKIESLGREIESGKNIEIEFKEAKKENLSNIRVKHQGYLLTYEQTKEKLSKLQKKSAIDTDGIDLNTLLAEADKTREIYYEVKDRLSNVQRDISDYQRQLTRVDLTIKTLWQQLADIKDNCPYCGGVLDKKQIVSTKKKVEEKIKDEVTVKREFEQKIGKLGASEVNIQKEYEVAHSAFTDAMQSYDEAKTESKAVTTTSSAIQQCQLDLKLLEKDIQNAIEAFNKEKERKPPTVNLDELVKSLDTEEAKLPEINKSITKYKRYIDRLTWWIKNAFGANGLKAYVFSAMLNKLNECLTVYTTYFGYTVTIGIDLSKASKSFFCRVTMDGINEIDYSELSGGQKQKIDLCVAFAMHDVTTVKSSFNILLLDEVAEGLDASAQEMLDTLLRIKAETKAVYIVSHNNQMDLSGCIEYEVTGGNKSTSIIQ